MKFAGSEVSVMGVCTCEFIIGALWQDPGDALMCNAEHQVFSPEDNKTLSSYT